MAQSNQQSQIRIATVLNFAFWGLGYVYLREKMTFGLILLLGAILVHTYYIFILGIANWVSGSSVLTLIGHFTLSTAFAWDTYKNSE